MPWLINAAQVDKFRKNQKALIILDASWHLPTSGRDGKKEFLDSHIVGAHFFDIQAFTDKQPGIVHGNMVSRDETAVSQTLGDIGIRDDYKIILYDNSPLHTACRALWLLKIFGHNPQQLYILDGGLTAWNAYGGKTESGTATVSTKHYTAKFQPQYIKTLADIKTNVQNPTHQVIDVRHAMRYAGTPDSSGKLRSGHIPGSFSFPYTTMFDKDNCWRPLEKLRQQLSGIGADLNAPTITSCGSGTTAAVLNFALDLLGNTQNSLYNGSWTEWGANHLHEGEITLLERPVVTSLDE